MQELVGYLTKMENDMSKENGNGFVVQFLDADTNEWFWHCTEQGDLDAFETVADADAALKGLIEKYSHIKITQAKITEIEIKYLEKEELQ